MRLSHQWTNRLGWLFHIFDTGILIRLAKSLINGEEVDFSEILKMEFKQEWMEDDGEGNPANYDLLKSLAEEFFTLTEAGKFTPSTFERAISRKMIYYLLTKVKQDSAYRERIGGWLTVTILEPAPWQAATTKAERIAYFNRLHKWWGIVDKRERTYAWIDIAIKTFLKWYDESEYYEQATNWFYDRLVERRGEWQIDVVYDPKNWYPVGRGMIQNKIRGGMG